MGRLSDDELQNVADKQKIDFLKTGISYLENRISLVDNKASILIAVLGVFFGWLTYTVREVFLTCDSSRINVVGYLVLGGAFVIFVLSVLLLLQTIRPSRRFLGLQVRITDRDKREEDYVLWYGREFPTTLDDYTRKVDGLDLSKIKENYEKAHYTTLQLVRRKYRFYKPAALGMKLLVLWCGIGIAILSFLKW